MGPEDDSAASLLLSLSLFLSLSLSHPLPLLTLSSLLFSACEDKAFSTSSCPQSLVIVSGPPQSQAVLSVFLFVLEPDFVTQSKHPFYHARKKAP